MTEKLRLPVTKVTLHPDRLIESIEMDYGDLLNAGVTGDQLAEFIIRANRVLKNARDANWNWLPDQDISG